VGIGGDERHRNELAPGDVALIYVASPTGGVFIGRVELATDVREWAASEAAGYPGTSSSGVLLAHVERWDPPVPLGPVVTRIDPTGSNPVVQANAALGFRMGVVRITASEYEVALAVRREAEGT
jgi:hypothetical protein